MDWIQLAPKRGLGAFSFESITGILIWDFHSVVDDNSLLEMTKHLLEICYHKDSDWKKKFET
jgi:hypothetical protein